MENVQIKQRLEIVKEKLESWTEQENWLSTANQVKSNSGEEQALRLEIEEGAEMAAHTSFRAGGRAALLVTVGDARTLGFVLSVLSAEEIPHFDYGSRIALVPEQHVGAVPEENMRDFLR